MNRSFLGVFGLIAVLAGLGGPLQGCDGSSGHMLSSGMGGGMMGGGMMGGGMMGQTPGSSNVQTLPEPQSEEARLFRQFCGQCHVPPAPSAHTAREWPEVVARMRQYIEMQGKAAPDDEQLQQIFDYLQRHAK